jgi:hypothetical protein
LEKIFIQAIHRKHAGRHFSEDSNFCFYLGYRDSRSQLTRWMPQERTLSECARGIQAARLLRSGVAGSGAANASGNFTPAASHLITNVGILDGNPKYQSY